MQRPICLAVLYVLALLATGTLLSARQQAAPGNRARLDSLGQTQRNLTDSFLPFQAGNRWEYQACEILEDQNGENSRPKPCHSFSESVTQAAVAGSSIVVTEFRRRGFTSKSKYSVCVFEDGEIRQVYWYLTTRIGVFLACTPADKSILEGELKEFEKHPDRPLLEDPEFPIPFEVGAKWFNHWTVTARFSKTVAAGAFDDCYELTQDIPTRRGPRIEQKRWVCKGIGVVAYDLPGESAGSRYRIELVDCIIAGGPACPHRPIHTLPK